MKSKSILNIAVKDICDLADISRSTFYDHYKDQYDLLRQIEDEALGYLEDMLKNYDDKHNKRHLIEMIEEVLTYVLNNNYFQVLLSEHGNIEFQKKIFKHLTLRKQITKLFSEKIDDDEAKECYYVYVVNGTIGLVQHWIKNNMLIPVPKLAKMMIKWNEKQLITA